MNEMIISQFSNLSLELGTFWLSVLGTAGGFFAVFWIVKRVVAHHLFKVSKATDNSMDDAFYELVDKWNSLALAIIAVYLSTRIWQVPASIQRPISIVTLMTFIFFGVRTLNHAVSVMISQYVQRQKRASAGFDPTLVSFSKRFIQVIIWLIGFLLVAQNLGYNVTALLGGLGLGGVAVAFAVQNILGDIFSSISIYFDKPFQVGDTIKIDSDVGTVKKVGIRSTRLQTLDGQELVIANTDITTSRVHNFKRMPKRRVVFQFGVTYETKAKKLASIPGLVEDIFKGLDDADLNRVHLIDLAEYSISFEVVYYIGDRDYKLFRDTHQKVLLDLYQVLTTHKIEFAYPTQRVVE